MKPLLFLLVALPVSAALAQPVYVVLFTHIEDNTPAADLSTPQAKLQYAQLRAGLIVTAEMARARGIRWCLQPDWKFLLAALRFEDSLVSPATNGKPFLRYLKEDAGAVIDPHSHEKGGFNYTDVAHLLDSLGVGGSTVIGGHIWDPSLPSFQQWDRFRDSVAGTAFPWARWRGDILMGSGTPNHVNDPLVSGLWNPRDRWHYWEHDAAANVTAVGQYTGDIVGVLGLLALQRSGAVPPACMLTLSIHVTPASLATPAGRSAVNDTVFTPLARLRDSGLVEITDFTALRDRWRAAGATSCIVHEGTTEAAAAPVPAPSAVRIDNLYPNPARRRAVLAATLAAPAALSVDVVALRGALALERPLGVVDAGPVRIPLDLKGLAPGLYFVRLRSAMGVAAAPLLLLF